MEQPAGSTAENAIDVDETPERLRGGPFEEHEEHEEHEELEELEELSDSEDEADHSVYEIESDQEEEPEQSGMRSSRRSRTKRRLADSLSEEDNDYTPLPAKRRRTAARKQDKSVEVFVPLGIWFKIFSFSQPKFLARARRVSKAFRALIDDEVIWRRARVYNSPEYPDPVLGLKESEMWNLYLGTGCMICHTPKTKKCYWRFRIRCCVDCLKQATIKEYVLKDRPGFKPWWMQYLIPGALDSWGNWTMPSTRSSTYCQKVFWLDDIKAFENRMKPRGISDRILRAEVLKSLKDVQVIEEFEEKLYRERGKGAELINRQRYTDIREKISRLDPPLTDEILYHIPAYEAAIRIKRPLTDRSWKILLKKLEVGRITAAETIAKIEQVNQEAKLPRAGRGAINIMKPWIDYFLTLDGGTIEYGCEAAFALRAMNYTRTRWFTQEKSRIFLSAAQQLWDEKLSKLLHKPGKIFMCVFCDEKYAMSTVFNHIASEHSKEMGWIGVTASNPSGYWRGEEWPAELPILGFSKPAEATVASIASKQVPVAPPLVLTLQQKEGKEHHQAQMVEVLSRIRPFHMVPDSHRLFLWFHLSIAIYSRGNRVPNITLFAVAAEDVRQSSGEPIFKEPLRCGICNAYKSKKKKPWLWTTLSQHFTTHLEFQKQWPEKLLMLPSKVEISKSCSELKDKEVRRQWIALVKEADKKLGGALDDEMRLEENAARVEGIREEEGDILGKSSGGMNGEESGGQAGDLLLKRGREIEPLRISKRGYGYEGDSEGKRLKVGSNISSFSSEAVVGVAVSGVKPVVLVGAGGGTSGQKLWVEATTSTSNSPQAGSGRGILLPPLTETWRGRRALPEAGCSEAGELAMSPPAHAKLVGNYKNMPVPQFSGTSPQDITEISRAHGIARKSIEVLLPMSSVRMPPEILETQALTRIANSKPNRPETDRDRSPSVSMDIEELFADA